MNFNLSSNNISSTAIASQDEPQFRTNDYVILWLFDLGSQAGMGFTFKLFQILEIQL